MSDYEDWARHHALVFSLTTAEDAKMLLAWGDLFAASNFSPDELTQATDWLAMNSPPRFRTEHLKALQDRVRQSRQRTIINPPEDDRGSCTLCFGAGLIPVPNPKSLDTGNWTTQAVACGCALGHWFAQHGNHRTLSDYERQCPQWRTDVKQHEAFHKSHVRAHSATKAVDDALGAILARNRGQAS